MQNWFLVNSGKNKETNKHIKNVNRNPEKRYFKLWTYRKHKHQIKGSLKSNAKARKQQIVPKPKTKMTFLGNTKEEDLQLTEGRNNSFNTHRGGLNVGPVQEML